jgi:predicted hotdog family 3-hydroxylacyl-ACP dehydratase
MRLLHAVIAHDEVETRCSLDPAASALFAGAGGRIPAWVGIEYMAQCAAVHGGLVARASGEAPRPGLLLGSRRVVFRCEGFAPGRILEVTARHAAGRGPTLAFDCALLDPDGGPPWVEGRLTVFVPRELPAPGGSAP